ELILVGIFYFPGLLEPCFDATLTCEALGLLNSRQLALLRKLGSEREECYDSESLQNRMHAREQNGSFQMATLRINDHCTLCQMVFALFAQLSRPERDDAGARIESCPYYNLSMGSVLRT